MTGLGILIDQLAAEIKKIRGLLSIQIVKAKKMAIIGS